jgi:type II secretory pathway component GspD/PulD (secretin)
MNVGVSVVVFRPIGLSLGTFSTAWRPFMAILLRLLICASLMLMSTATALAQDAPATPAEQTSDAAKTDADAKETAVPLTADAKPGDDTKLTFNFRYQPWQDVLDWFAEQAGLSLLIESPPPGTFNYSDTKGYTAAEALDVLNGVLLTKGYTLVRRGRMLVLVNLEDGVPPNLVPDVPLEELDYRGEYLVRVLFPVWNMSPEQAAEEVQPILGPQGKVVTLPQARQIQVTETAGRLRTIRSIVNAVEQPELGKAGLREFPLKHVTFEAAIPTIRQMLGIPAEAYSTPDGSMNLTKSAVGERILFRGTAQHAARLEAILRLIDVPEAAAGINGAPQLEVYAVSQSDPEAVLKVLQSLMRDDTNVSLSADADAGQIIAFATPPQQATIKATIDQMQKDSREVAVFALANTNPQVAVLAIDKLFGSLGDEPDPKAPRVDADLSSNSLFVRGTPSQLDQIRNLLRQLGETEDGEGGRRGSREHVRLIPLTGAQAKTAIEQIEQIWPSVRSNRIRVIAPNTTIQTYRPSDSGQAPVEENRPGGGSPANSGADLQELWQMLREPAGGNAPQQQQTPRPDDGADNRKSIFRYAQNTAADETTQPKQNSDGTSAPAPSPRVPRSEPVEVQPPAPDPSKGAPVIVTVGPNGVVIASDDLEALDELEDMFASVSGKSSSSAREYSVFYLKYAKAATIAEVLAAIFGGSSGGSDKGLIGDMASNALGDVGGALMGDLLLGGGGGGGGAFSSASVDIVPDARLNALIVHAKPADRDTVWQLIQILDQRTGPENVEADGQPRPIPVYNTTATKIAEVVQTLYADRMSSTGGAMSPQEMMRMIRGGPNTDQQIQKMSIAVDVENNMLIVRAPDPLFEEVKALVAELDATNSESPETTRVVSLKHSNSAAVQRALNSILDNVETSTTSSTSSDSSESRRRRDNDDDDSPEDRARRAMRRNWEMMQEMRRMQERMGGDRGGGDGDRSRFFRGGPGGPGGFGGRGGGDGGGDRGRGDGDRGGRD